MTVKLVAAYLQHRQVWHSLDRTNPLLEICLQAELMISVPPTTQSVKQNYSNTPRQFSLHYLAH